MSRSHGIKPTRNFFLRTLKWCIILKNEDNLSVSGAASHVTSWYKLRADQHANWSFPNNKRSNAPNSITVLHQVFLLTHTGFLWTMFLSCSHLSSHHLGADASSLIPSSAEVSLSSRPHLYEDWANLLFSSSLQTYPWCTFPNERVNGSSKHLRGCEAAPLRKKCVHSKKGFDKAPITLLPFVRLATEIVQSEMLMPLFELCLAI